jgi:methylenetetrahydrofolate reductase (NADPH)
LYGEDVVYSLEVFPPRNGELLDMVFDTIESLLRFDPAFVSVTGGALGSRRGGTIAIAALVKRKYGIEGVVHFTCVDKSKQDIENLLIEMKYNGIENVLALRGDPPKGMREFVPHPQGHRYASDLVAQINRMNAGKYLTDKEGEYREGIPTDFCVGVAAYPEGHPECPDKRKDLENLKIKVDAGADYIVTQAFFDTCIYLEFRERAERIRINVPIVAGVMPLQTYSQVKFFQNQMGVSIPKDFKDKLENHREDKDYVWRVCQEHTLSTVEKLIRNGVPGIQFFTLNKPAGTYRVLQELAKKENTPVALGQKSGWTE